MQAREWIEYCSDSEWGNITMREIAQGRFDADPSVDVVCVYEHGGWHLSFNRDGITVGTANDMGRLSNAAYQWASQFTDRVIVGECRRQDDGGHDEVRYPNYYPALAVA